VTVGRYVPESLAGRVDRWFKPSNVPGILLGFDKRGGFSVPEFHEADQGLFRWSFAEAQLVLHDHGEATTLVLNVSLPPPVPSDYAPNLRFYVRRGGNIDGVFGVEPCRTIDEYRPGAFDVSLPVPPGKGTLRIGWRIRTVNLYREGVSDDDRDLGLRVNWIGYLMKHDDAQVSTGSETIRKEP
jgi:hypothetical protein